MSKPIGLVVRRGALRRFDALKRKTENLPVDVIWDQRQGDRRVGADDGHANRRRTDRRRTPPFTWELADFVVVEPAEER